MNSAKKVGEMIAKWKAEGKSKVEILVLAAEACLGWPYVWGSYGQYCTVSNRKAYSKRSSLPSGEAEQIIKKCQVLNGKKKTCSGCKYYPSGETVRIFDCRGFTKWILSQIGISLKGAGATSQWNNKDNWAVKGVKKDLPSSVVACVFYNKGDKMNHTGFHIGDGKILHCSGEVISGKLADRIWTHYAVPVGLYDEIPDTPVSPEPISKPMLKKSVRNKEAVKELQTLLLSKGYDLGKWGVDGSFGNATLAAVKAFQADNGLKVDGIVGPLTWAKLLIA